MKVDLVQFCMAMQLDISSTFRPVLDKQLVDGWMDEVLLSKIY